MVTSAVASSGYNPYVGVTRAAAPAKAAVVAAPVAKAVAAAAAPANPTMTVARAIQALQAGTLNSKVLVRDTTANIQRGMAGLDRIASLGLLKDVVFSDRRPSVTLTGRQAENTELLNAVKEASLRVTGTNQVTVNAADAVLLAGKGVGNVNFEISDSAAGLQARVGEVVDLYKAGRVRAVNLTDSATGNLYLSADQAAAIGPGAGGNRRFLQAVALPQVATPASVVNKLPDGQQNQPPLLPVRAKVTVYDSLAGWEPHADALIDTNLVHYIEKAQVVDTGANISTQLAEWSADGLTGRYAPHIDSLVARDGGAVTLSVAQALDANLMKALRSGPTEPKLVISDTAANLLKTSGNEVFQLEVLRGSFSDPGSVTATVKDTASNIMSRSIELERYFSRGLVTAVSLQDKGKVVEANVAQVLGSKGLFEAIAADGGTVKIKDTAANISANLDSVQQMVDSGLVTARSGITVTDSKAVLMSVEQYGRGANLRALLPTFDSVVLRMGNANNVLSGWRGDLAAVIGGAGNDTVYAGNTKPNLLVNLGAGSSDSIRLVGSKADWTLTRMKATDFEADMGNLTTGQTLANIGGWSAVASSDSVVINDTLEPDGADAQAYRFSHVTTGAKVYVLGGERYGFFDSGTAPKGTVDLLA